MSARQVVLERIRQALAADPPTPTDQGVARTYRTKGRHEPGATALLDLLEERTLDYRAAFLRATPDLLATQIAAALADGLARAQDGGGHVIPRILVPPGLDRQWVSEADGEIVADDATLTPATLDTMHAVVTACALAIAETGTIVLDGSSDQGRRMATLIPDLHICVVHGRQVVGTVPEALARLDASRPMTFISGPSATSDIELDRVEGVHGPRQLIVVLLTGVP
jgi:L-lactate dehydrogenase complex protein LldG